MMRLVFKLYSSYLFVMLFLFLYLLFIKQLEIFASTALEYFSLFSFLILFNNKYIKGGVWSCLLLVLGIQMASLYTSGNMVIPLTLSNLGEYNAIGSILLLKLIVIVFSFFITSLPIYFSSNYSCSVPFSKLMAFTIVLFPFFNGPFFTFSKTLYSYYEQITFTPVYNYPELANKYLKVGVWGKPSTLTAFNNPNVIVIFTEGMSASVIDKVNGKGLGVTPNIDSLYKNSIVFNNYFNHTAATFRGLRGQLTSAYQYKDGVGTGQDGFFEISNETVRSTFDKRLISLPEILNAHGYKTIFLSSTERNSTLNAMVKTLSFDEVYGMGDFDFYQNDRMTDRQTFLSLADIVNKNKNNKFFIGVYTSGTHHGIDSPDMIYKDGKNPYYNKFYNFDYQLGLFINNLKKSGVLDNTMVVITADHATFPTPEFNSSFGTNAKYFIDTIPLLIIGGSGGRIIDAMGSNSLSLTPTILQLLNINNTPNFFLGCSLLDVICKSRFSNISAIGKSFFKTDAEEYPDYNVQELNKSDEILNFYNISG